MLAPNRPYSPRQTTHCRTFAFDLATSWQDLVPGFGGSVLTKLRATVCLLLLGILASSCSSTPIQVQIKDIVTSRPGVYGFSPRAGRWRKVQFRLPDDQLRDLIRFESTVFLGFNDCSGQVLFSPRGKLKQQPIEEAGHIWLKGHNLSEVHLMDKRDIESLLHDPLLTSYIDEDLYAATLHVCAFLKGGNMISYSVPKSEFRLK